MVYLTRRVTFNAAHKLAHPAWTQARNEEVFGRCAYANWHGHNYELFVTVRGVPDADTGFVMDAKALKDLVAAEVTEQLDHRNLNLDVPWLSGVRTTSENIARAIWGRLAPKLTGCTLYRVRLVETENIFVDYYGDAEPARDPTAGEAAADPHPAP